MNVFFINRLKYCFFILTLVYIYNSYATEVQPIYKFPDKWHIINKFSFTSDGKSIVVAGQINYKNSICFYNFLTKNINAKIEFDGSKSPCSYSISDDKNAILVGYYSFYVWADLYDVNTSELIQKFGPHNYPPFDKRVDPMIIDVSLSPQKKWVLTTTPTEGCITHIWDTETGKNVKNISAYSPNMPFIDDNRVFLGDDLYDLETETLIIDLSSCSYIFHAFLSFDKKLLVIPGFNNLSICDWGMGIKVKELPTLSTRVFLSPDNKYLADCSYYYGIRIWDIEKEEIIKTFDLNYSSYEFSPDWKYLLTYEYHDSPTGYSIDDYLTIFLWRVEDLFKVTSVENFENY